MSVSRDDLNTKLLESIRAENWAEAAALRDELSALGHDPPVVSLKPCTANACFNAATFTCGCCGVQYCDHHKPFAAELCDNCRGCSGTIN
jgi:hypothetical protein